MVCNFSIHQYVKLSVCKYMFSLFVFCIVVFVCENVFLTSSPLLSPILNNLKQFSFFEVPGNTQGLERAYEALGITLARNGEPRLQQFGKNKLVCSVQGASFCGMIVSFTDGSVSSFDGMFKTGCLLGWNAIIK